MTKKQTKPKKQITFYIDSDVAEEFRVMCFEQDINMSSFFRSAIFNKLLKDKKIYGANKVS